jgi:hypothetical protein
MPSSERVTGFGRTDPRRLAATGPAAFVLVLALAGCTSGPAPALEPDDPIAGFLGAGERCHRGSHARLARDCPRGPAVVDRFGHPIRWLYRNLYSCIYRNRGRMFVELQQVNYNTEVPLPGKTALVNLDHVVRVTVRDSEQDGGCTNAVLEHSNGTKTAVYVGPQEMTEALRKQRVDALRSLLSVRNQGDGQPLSFDSDVQFPKRITDPHAK